MMASCSVCCLSPVNMQIWLDLPVPVAAGLCAKALAASSRLIPASCNLLPCSLSWHHLFPLWAVTPCICRGDQPLYRNHKQRRSHAAGEKLCC
jgi:hypothetical protein